MAVKDLSERRPVDVTENVGHRPS